MSMTHSTLGEDENIVRDIVHLEADQKKDAIDVYAKTRVGHVVR